MRHLTLLLGIVLSANIGCTQTENKTGDTKGDKSTGSSSASSKSFPDQGSATAVANQVLAAIHAGDAAVFKPLLTHTNQELLSDDELVMFLKGEQGSVADVTQVTELRQGFERAEVLAKIRVAGDEVFVVVLTRKDDFYYFEEINSPSVADYESQTKIEP